MALLSVASADRLNGLTPAGKHPRAQKQSSPSKCPQGPPSPPQTGPCRESRSPLTRPPRCSRNIVEPISIGGIECVRAQRLPDGEALPHRNGREREESDRLLDLRFQRLRVTGILGSASGIGNLRFGHDFLGKLGALSSSFRV